MITLLIDICFLLFLLSGLSAGAWAFYNLIVKNQFLFKEDFLILETLDETRKGLEEINTRLESLELKLNKVFNTSENEK